MPLMMPPGYTYEKEKDSDTDEEAVAARRVEKESSKTRIAKQEAQERAATREAALRHAEFVDNEQVLKAVCSEQERTQVTEVLSNLERPRQDADTEHAFETRVKMATELRELAKQFFQKSDNIQAVIHWLGVVHYLDFTRNELSKRTAEERVQVDSIMAPVLSNLSLAFRKRDDPSLACRAADWGLDYARGLPCGESKKLRVKLYLRRALAKGERRDFDGARDDAQHALQLSPDDEDAKCIHWNAERAIRRSKTRNSPQWTRPLDAPIPKKVEKRGAKLYLTIATVLLGPLLAYYFGKALM